MDDPSQAGTVGTPASVRTVVLERAGNEGFGFGIAGGADQNATAVFISLIHPGGLADRDGQLQVGHWLRG